MDQQSQFFASFSLFQSTVDVRTIRDFCEMGEIINGYCRNNPQEMKLKQRTCPLVLPLF